MIRGFRKSFQIHTPRKIVTLAVAGRKSGNTIFQKISKRLVPSIAAASSSSRGIWRMNPVNTNTPNGT
jgi:hypothetical protein